MFKKHKGKKHNKVLNIAGAIGGALFALLLLFLVMDNFTLYWFMLFNNQSADRREADSAWYDEYGIGGGQGGGFSSSGGSGGGSSGSNYGNTGMLGKSELEAMTPEEAVAAVTKTLTDDQIRDPETAWRIFIYLMDRHGFVPNATIGAMSYIKQEGAGMGTFTYESYWCCPGPDGNKSSRHLNNQDWLDWLNGPGYQWAAANYAKRRAKGESLAYAAIGLGSVQSSDVWDGPGSKKTANATALIEAANEKGLYWQDPAFQLSNYMTRYFVSSEPFGAGAWDVNQCPGVDPTRDNNVTAEEYCRRVLCGVGYPGWKSTTVAANHPDSYNSHIQGLEACADLYAKYSKKDEWFYTERPKTQQPVVPGSTVEQTWPCPSCGAKNAQESTWRCPFCGPEYSNSTYMGRTIARVALLMSSENKITAKGSYGSFDNLSGQVELQRHRYGITTINDVYHKAALYACCADFGLEAVVLSGADPDFPARRTSIQEMYMIPDTRWRYIGVMNSPTGVSGVDGQSMTLQPGDLLYNSYLSNSSKYGSGEYVFSGSNSNYGHDFTGTYACGHVAVYIGTNIMNERFPGSSRNICEGSVAGDTSPAYYPCTKTPWAINSSKVREVRVWRCVDPVLDGTAWNTYYDTYHTETWWDIPGKYPFTS